MDSNEGVKQAGKQQKDKQQAKKIPAYAGSYTAFFSISTGYPARDLSKYGNVYMTDINRNQGSVNYQRVIQVRRSLHQVTPELMHEIVKAAGCFTRFADDGMAFFTHTVGRCEYPLNPCGSFTNKWVGEQCKAQGFTRECHGDIHLGNATVIDGNVVIFDCIEFNEPFRFTDVYADGGWAWRN